MVKVLNKFKQAEPTGIIRFSCLPLFFCCLVEVICLNRANHFEASAVFIKLIAWCNLNHDKLAHFPSKCSFSRLIAGSLGFSWGLPSYSWVNFHWVGLRGEKLTKELVPFKDMNSPSFLPPTLFKQWQSMPRNSQTYATCVDYRIFALYYGAIFCE